MAYAGALNTGSAWPMPNPLALGLLGLACVISCLRMKGLIQ